MDAQTLKIISMNCQGLRNSSKRNDVLNFLKSKNIDILCLQDTHLLTCDLDLVKDNWDGEIILHGFNTYSRGVAILLKNTLQYKILSTHTDSSGNMIVLHMKCLDQTLLLINAYGPSFFKI